MSEAVANFCYMFGLDDHILTCSSAGMENEETLMSSSPIFQPGPALSSSTAAGPSSNSNWSVVPLETSTGQRSSLPEINSLSRPAGESNLKPATLLVKSALTLLNPHPLDRIYDSKLLLRYPFDSQLPSNGKSFPQHLGQFCFPMQCKMSAGTATPFRKASDAPKSGWHSFVITDNYGNKQHAICLTFYRPITESAAVLKYYHEQFDLWKQASYSKSDLEYVEHVQEKLTETLVEIEKLKSRGESAEEFEDKCNLYNTLLAPFDKLNLTADKVFMPFCLGLIGNHPFYSFYRDWLVFILNKFDFDLGKSRVPFERYLSQLFHRVLLPPPGQLELLIQLDDHIMLPLSRPAPNQAAVSISLPVYNLFCALSLNHIITVLEHVIVESKVLFVSAHLSLLNIAAEIFTALLFPLKWQHTYIPVLPIQLVEFIQAPFPFIIGIHSAMVRDTIPDDVLLVDLDRDALKMGMYSRTPVKEYFSTRTRRKLLSRLQKYCAIDSTQRQQFFSGNLTSDARVGWWNRYDAESVQLTKEKVTAKSTLQKFEKPNHRKDSVASVSSVSSFWGFTSGWKAPVPLLPNMSSLVILERDEQHTSKTKDIADIPPKVPDKSPKKGDGSLISVGFNNNQVTSRSSSISALSPVSVPPTPFTENPLPKTVTDIKITIEDDDNKKYLETVSKSPRLPLKRLLEKKPSDSQLAASRLSLASSIGNSTHESTASSNMPDYNFYFYPYKLSDSSTSQEDSYSWFHSSISKTPTNRDSSLSFSHLSIKRVTCPAITHRIASTFNLKTSFTGDSKTSLADIKLHGHSFQSVQIMDDSPSTNSNVSTGFKYALSGHSNNNNNVNNNIPVGWCAVCNGLVKMPPLRAVQSVVTKSGIASVCESDTANSHSSAAMEVLQCSKCHLVLHPECSSKIPTEKEHQLTHCSASFDFTGIQVCVIRLWAALLSTYKENMRKPEGSNENVVETDDDLIRLRMRMDNMLQRMRGYTGQISDEQRRAIPKTSIFDADAFLSSVALDDREFVSLLLATQSMTQFIYDRSSESQSNDIDNSSGQDKKSEEMFFDEVVVWRGNKSVLSTQKQIPFLSNRQDRRILKVDAPSQEQAGYFKITFPLNMPTEPQDCDKKVMKPEKVETIPENPRDMNRSQPDLLTQDEYAWYDDALKTIHI